MSKSIRQIARQKATFAIYQNLTVNASEQDMLNYIKMDNQLEEGKSGYSFCVNLIQTIMNHKESYIKAIEKELKKSWTFERLNKMEGAILLVATCELLESDLDRRIIINEAVINAKEFCDENSYKFINGVLNDIL